MYTNYMEYIQMKGQMFHTGLRKLLTLLIVSLFGYCSLSAQETANKVSILSDAITMEEAFAEIEKQTGYSIAYEQSALNLKKKLSLSFLTSTMRHPKKISKSSLQTMPISPYVFLLISLF